MHSVRNHYIQFSQICNFPKQLKKIPDISLALKMVPFICTYTYRIYVETLVTLN